MRFAIAVLLFVASVVGAEEPPKSWKGEMVVGKKLPSEVKFGDRIDDERTEFEFRGIYPIAVRDDKDGWLKIFDGHREGWAEKADFVHSDDAPAYFAERIRLDPKDAFAWSARGMSWLYRGEYDNAIDDFDQCIKLDPKSASSFNFRGNAQVLKKEYDKAIKDYDEATAIDPKFVLPYINRGLVHHAKKEFEKAIREYSDAIRLDSECVCTYYYRGMVWADKKEYVKAIKDYSEAIRLDPKYADAFLVRAMAWDDRKEFDKAIADCNEVLRLDKTSLFAIATRGCVWRNKKEYAKAIKDFEEVIRLDPASPYGPGNRAQAYAKLRKYDGAVRDFENAMKLGEVDWVQASFSLFLATCPDAKFRDGAKALDLAKAAIEKAGKDAPWSFMSVLAAALAETGDFDKAVRVQKAALADKSMHVDDRKEQKARLKLYQAKKPFRDE